MSDKGDQIQVVKIEGEGVKSVANLLMILVVAFIMTVPVAIYAVVAVEAYKDRIDTEMALYQRHEDERIGDLAETARRADYWCDQASVKADAMNLGFPSFKDHTIGRKIK